MLLQCNMQEWKAYTYISVSALDPKALANPYSAIIACPVEVDLYNRTLTLIKDLPFQIHIVSQLVNIKTLLCMVAVMLPLQASIISIQLHAKHGDQLLKLWAIQALSSLRKINLKK